MTASRLSEEALAIWYQSFRAVQAAVVERHKIKFILYTFALPTR